jgi:hypothetical protein
MAYINRFDKDGNSSKEGHNAEALFCEIAKSKGYLIEKSSKSDNMHKHIDFTLEGKDKKVTVDIKARKRTSRKDKKFTDDWIWLEIKNVQGRKGWLYGQADFIVFETEDSFILSPRKSLIELVNSTVRFDLSFVDRAYQAKYRIYQRAKRRDQITQVKMKDILSIKNVVTWKKKN